MQKYKMGELLTVKHGWAFKGEYFCDEGEQSILTPGNFYEKGGFKYNDGKERFYSGEYPSEYLCKKGDLVVAMTEQVAGLLGSTAIVPKDDRYLHNQRIGLITCDEGKITKMFAYYLFMTKSVRNQLELTSSGTKVKHTSPERIYDVEVEIPGLDDQKKIADLLWTIDERIRVNNEINDNLYASMKAKYNHYFLQYSFLSNSILDKENGVKMKWSNELNKDIPYNWSVKKLQDICNLQYGYPLSTELFSSNGLPVIRIRDIESNSFSAKTTEQIDNCYYTEPQDLLIGMDGNFQMNFWHKAGYIVNQRITRIRRTSMPLLLVKFQIEPYIVAKSKNVARSTVGHLSDDDIKNLFIIVPDNSLDVSEYDLALERIIHNINENDELTSLRDWLLPMLMNGQAIITD